jgi:nuclear transport factor 2 (NTF2) superfamily protein
VREQPDRPRFAYEWHVDSRIWFRSFGHENVELDERG